MQTQRPMIQDISEIGLQLKNMREKMLLIFRTTERAPFEDVPHYIIIFSKCFANHRLLSY